MAVFRKPGIVNVRMVITEEKILSNIDKVQKMINPSSKKQIVQLEEDSYFKDLIDSIKTYLIEYPKKKNFPSSVYKAAYQLVEFATNQFEENTKEIEELIRQREKNISLAVELKQIYQVVLGKDESWKDAVKAASDKLSEDMIEALSVIGKSKNDNTPNYKSAVKLIEARINNLEANLHIEIDMERIEDRSKALSYIGIEVAEALKQIPTPVDYISNAVEEKTNNVEEAVPVAVTPEEQTYMEETRYDVKPSLWARIKNSSVMRTLGYLFKIRISLQLPKALPEGKNK